MTLDLLDGVRDYFSGGCGMEVCGGNRKKRHCQCGYIYTMCSIEDHSGRLVRLSSK